MRKAYDTVLQCEVSADLFAEIGGFEPYRYECACCGEEVRIAAAESSSMVTHFRHRSGNNDIECENYLGQYGLVSINSGSRKSDRERAEFYFESTSKTFSLGLRFSEKEIFDYEQRNVNFELRTAVAENAFQALRINSTNFYPDMATMIPLNKFSLSYYLSNTHSGANRKYDFFKPQNAPAFFKVQGTDTDFRAKLVRSNVLYTNTEYFVVLQSRYFEYQFDAFNIDTTFSFDTMGRRFAGIRLSIQTRTTQIDSLISSWGYRLEASESLSLLWPPASLVEDTSIIAFDYAFFYSTFQLQAHGNINVHADAITKLSSGLSKVSILAKTKVFKKNAEIAIDKGEQQLPLFDKLDVLKLTANNYIVPNDCLCFAFGHDGVSPLSQGQSVLLTPQSRVRHYRFGYLTKEISNRQQEVLNGPALLNDMLAHYKRDEHFEKSYYASLALNETASEYIRACEVSGRINSAAKSFITEGRL